jgi:hypothetical protein
MRILLLAFLSIFLIQIHAQQPVIPQKDGTGNYSFTLGNAVFQVNPNHGARIISYKLNGLEFLHVSQVVADMYGSTAWLSPQTLWNWPPQKQIDTDPYTGGVKGNNLILTSATASADNNSLKFQIRKTFSADLQDSSVTILYTIINKSSAAKSFAVWEIMRVPTGGLSLFPINGAITGDLAPFFKIQTGVAWWDYDSLQNNRNKAFADGKDGWMAHVDNNRHIIIKKFPDAVSNFPIGTNGQPLEKEIEYYAESNRYYNEIEKHSSYTLVPVNDSTSLSMTWYLRELPENIAVRVGNPDLVSYIDRIVNPVTNGIQNGPSPDESFRVYPNPSSGEIRYRGADSTEKLSFLLMNILGKTFFNQTISNQPGRHLPVNLSSGNKARF